MTGVTHVLRLSVFAIAALIGAQGLVYGQTKEFDQTVDLASGGRLILDGSKGDVEIIAWDEERVEIKARIEAPSGDVSADYARRAVEATTVDVDVSSGSVSIRSNYDDVPERSGSWGYRSRSVPYVHYEIRAPRELDLRVEVDRGDTEIEGFNGRIELDTDRGTLDAMDLSGTFASSWIVASRPPVRHSRSARHRGGSYQRDGPGLEHRGGFECGDRPWRPRARDGRRASSRFTPSSRAART